MTFKPTPEGKKKLKELDELCERHRPMFEKIAAVLAKRRERRRAALARRSS